MCGWFVVVDVVVMGVLVFGWIVVVVVGVG